MQRSSAKCCIASEDIQFSQMQAAIISLRWATGWRARRDGPKITFVTIERILG